MTDRITIRLGSLAAPLEAYCSRHRVTPSNAIRAMIAAALRVTPPPMVPGNPAIGEQASAGAAARWQKPSGKRTKRGDNRQA